MWTKSYSKKVVGLSAAEVWNIWTDVNSWSQWQTDTQSAQMSGDFAVGNSFVLHPKGGPKVTIAIVDVQPNRAFTDMTSFPLAKMYGKHEFLIDGDALEIKTTMSVSGPLAFLWAKLVAEGIVKGIPQQTDELIAAAKASTISQHIA